MGTEDLRRTFLPVFDSLWFPIRTGQRGPINASRLTTGTNIVHLDSGHKLDKERGRPGSKRVGGDGPEEKWGKNCEHKTWNNTALE